MTPPFETACFLCSVVDNMELAIDLELDLPKVWSCVAEQLAAVFYSSNGKVGLHRLKEMAAPLLKENKAAVFVAEVLKRLIKQTVRFCISRLYYQVLSRVF